jgi:Tol biopolymer transport system component
MWIGFFDERRTHIFTVDVETGDEKQITDGDWYDDQPAWSPDGESIAFVSDRTRTASAAVAIRSVGRLQTAAERES